MFEIKLFAGEGVRSRLEAVALACGGDWSVTVTGGELPHVGAAALAVPCPPDENGYVHRASVSVLCAPGHREDELARAAALKLAGALNCTVAVSVGFHIDSPSPEEIAAVVANCEQLCALLCQRIKEERFAK